MNPDQSNRVSRFRGDDSEPELENEDDDDVFNNRDNDHESNFDTMYGPRHGGKSSIQESDSTTLHRDADKNKTKTMGSLNSLVTNTPAGTITGGPAQGQQQAPNKSQFVLPFKRRQINRLRSTSPP